VPPLRSARPLPPLNPPLPPPDRRPSALPAQLLRRAVRSLLPRPPSAGMASPDSRRRQTRFVLQLLPSDPEPLPPRCSLTPSRQLKPDRSCFKLVCYGPVPAPPRPSTDVQPASCSRSGPSTLSQPSPDPTRPSYTSCTKLAQIHTIAPLDLVALAQPRSGPIASSWPKSSPTDRISCSGLDPLRPVSLPWLLLHLPASTPSSSQPPP
jgi:hypothetical protein